MIRLSPPRRNRPAQFNIRTLLTWVLVISVLLAIGTALGTARRADVMASRDWLLFLWAYYEFALIVFLTGLLVIFTDWAAFAIFPRRDVPFPPNRKLARRLCRRSWATPTKYFTPDPVILAAAHITIYAIGHFALLLTFKGSYIVTLYGLTTGSGLSIRTMVHSVNALVLVYLAAHLIGTLFPHAEATRNDRIPLIVAMIVVAELHFAVF